MPCCFYGYWAFRFALLFFHELLRRLSGIFRELKARQEVDVARGTAYFRFPDALRFVGLVELRPLLLELLHGSLFIHNTSFDRFIQTGIGVKRLSAIEAAPACDIEFRYNVRHPYDELSAQRDHRNRD